MVFENQVSFQNHMSSKNLSGELRQDAIWLIQQINPYSLPAGNNYLVKPHGFFQ